MGCTCYNDESERTDLERKPHRQMCGICNEICTVDVDVPCEIWRAALQEKHWYGAACVRCFTRNADERGVEWDKEIKFYPTSRARHDREVMARWEARCLPLDKRTLSTAAERALIRSVIAWRNPPKGKGKRQRAMATMIEFAKAVMGERGMRA